MKRDQQFYLLILTLVLLFNPILIQRSKSAPTIRYVDDDNLSGPWVGTQEYPYKTIQDAINNSSPFDHIYVFNGTYTQLLSITHAITLIGEEKTSTIIEGQQGHSALYLSGNHTNITGFTFRNSTYGLHIINTTNCIISNNNFQNLHIGIEIDNRSNNNTLYNNNFLNNTHHATDQGINAWDAGIPQGGNYWDNYTGVDTNQDAFGDTPFIITQGSATDRYPLIFPVTHPPVADFSYTPNIPYTFDIVQFTDRSTDTDGGIISWRWEFGDGNSSLIQQPTHRYHDNGVYTIKLTVTDYYGVTNQIAQPITVLNVPPTPLFEYNPLSPTDLDVISFNDNSTDIDGAIISWKWDFGDGNSTTEQHPTHKYADNGTYIVTLQVSDDDNTSKELSKQLEIRNVPPIAQFTLNPPNPILNDTITFQDTSIDLDGKIIIWTWEFGDDTTSTNRSPAYRYKKEGTYTIILQVMDNDGAQATVEKTVIIIDDKPAEEIPAVSVLLYSMYIAFFIAMIAMVLYIKKRFG